MKNIPALTSVRFLAALIVFFHHYLIMGGTRHFGANHTEHWLFRILIEVNATEQLVTGMFADNAHVYLSLSDPAMLEIWDFSDPANPARGGSAQIEQAGPILVSGSLASIAAELVY